MATTPDRNGDHAEHWTVRVEDPVHLGLSTLDAPTRAVVLDAFANWAEFRRRPFVERNGLRLADIAPGLRVVYQEEDGRRVIVYDVLSSRALDQLGVPAPPAGATV